SGSGVNLLNIGAMTSGARTLMTSWNTVIAAKAHIHQKGPVLSMNQKRASRTGTPITAEIARPFSTSMTKSFGVVLLKPNRASTLNVEYKAKGGRITPKTRDTAATNRMPWRKG